MKRALWTITAVFCLLIISPLANGQGVIFNSYEEYLKETGTSFDGYIGHSYGAGRVLSLKFEKYKKPFKIKPRDIWGFVYHGHLFRISPADGVPAILVGPGKIYYYENGLAYLQMLRDGTKTGSFGVGVYCYVSKSIDSDVILLPLKGVWDEKKVKALIDENPAYAPLFNCMAGKKTLTDVSGRDCIDEFQGLPKEDKKRAK